MSSGEPPSDDPVAVDLETLTTGFIDHEEVWTELESMRNCWVDTRLDVGTFYYAAVKRSRFPRDFHEAQGWPRIWKKLFRGLLGLEPTD